MIELLCHIARELANMNLNPANYRIVIIPTSVEAENKIMQRMQAETTELKTEVENEIPLLLRAGHISGMPFRIDTAK